MSDHEYVTNRELKVANSGLFRGSHFDMGMLSLHLILIFLIVSLTMGSEKSLEVYNVAKNWVTNSSTPLFVYGIFAMIIFSLTLAVSPFGRIRLGKDDEKPEFSRWSWFAMLFSAGMGIGLLYWSVAEPLYHTTGNVFMPEAWGLGWDEAWNQGDKEAIARQSMTVTFFHWGIHAWTVYVVIALSLAYFSYRRGLPLTVRSALYPIVGDNVFGWFGNIIDLIAIFGTIFGVATSLGLGVAQLNAGLEALTNGALSVSTPVQILLIVIITLIATVSAVSGVGKGVKILSELNMILSAIILLVFLVFTGFFFDIMVAYFRNLFNYVVEFIPMSLESDSSKQAGGYGWLSGWTIFYWAWWIAWSPFVGMFIARISRGRTIREFIIGVLFVPTLLGAFWLTVFGETALINELRGYADFAFTAGGTEYTSVRDVAIGASSSSTYALIEALDWSSVIKLIATFLVTILIATYFITSADSGTLVVTTMLSAGSDQPPRGARIFWGISIGAVASVLLWVGGDKALNALQAAAITIGLPFLVILLLMCVGLTMALFDEKKRGLIPARA